MQLDTIIQGDCLSVMKTFPDKSVDLIVTDPPYGIEASGGTGGFGNSNHTVKHYQDDWDKHSPSLEYFNELLRIGKLAIIFGGNFFTDKLPQGNHWIVWDKTGEIKFDNPYSDCELIWTNHHLNTIKKYVVIQQGFISKEKERYHPTQKPVDLLMSIINDYSNESDLILDPFAGSGTTLVAAKRLKRHYIGIELEPKYVEICKRRLQQCQEPMF